MLAESRYRCPVHAVLLVVVAACSTGRPATVRPAGSASTPGAGPIFATPASAPAITDRTGRRQGGAAPEPALGSRAQAGLKEDDIAVLNSRILGQAAPPQADADLPVGPGDLIEVSVFEVEELSRLKVRIPITGTIGLPLIGQVPAAGRTALEIEQDIRERLQQKYMHDPHVSVFVHEHKSQRISIVGAVTHGGVFPLSGHLRLADALGMAEGLTGEADHHIYLVRNAPASPGATALEPVTIAIDLDELAKGRDEFNIRLEAGDVIHVPRAGSYYVGGLVERPGSFPLRASTTLEQAVVAAGGVKDTADWADIRIYRMKPEGEREILTFDLAKIEKGEPAPAIAKNDVVIVGKSQTKAFFYGLLDFVKGRIGTVGFGL